VSRGKKIGLTVLAIVAAVVVRAVANHYWFPGGHGSPSISIGVGLLFAAAVRDIWRR